MKKSIAFLFAALSVMLAPLHAAEVVKVFAEVGPDVLGANAGQHTFTLPSVQEDTGAGSAFARFTVRFGSDLLLAPSGPSSPISIATAITGGGSSQSANVAYTGDMHNNEWWIVNPAGTTQEVVLIGSPTDATHVPGVFRKNHSVGEIMKKVFACFTVFVVPNVTGGVALSNFNLTRVGNLPADVYDHEVVVGSIGTEVFTEDGFVPWIDGSPLTPSISGTPAPVPQYDVGSISGTGNPTNGVVLVTGPDATAGIWTQVKIQYLICTPLQVSVSVDNLLWWDH